jgi:serine/threonine-protein kinase
MGPQTMMGAAPTTVSPYQSGGFQTGYQQPYPYGDGGYNGSGELEKQGGSRRWIPWLIAGIVAVAAIVVAVILLQGHGGGNTFVPSVAGESQSQAVSDIQAQGLHANVILQTDPNTQAGHVIKTDPAGGDSIAKGGTVKVYVSKGQGSIKIPDVTKLSQQDAQAKLTTAGFTNVVPVPDPQSTLPQGEVDHTNPVPGTSIPPGQQITLYVSGGGVKVPDVSSQGYTEAEAQALLNSAGFKNINWETKPAGSGQMVQPGTVYFQSPTAGTVTPTDTQITVFVQPEQATPTTSTSPTPTNSTSPTATPTNTATSTPTDTSTATPTNTATSPPPGQ